MKLWIVDKTKPVIADGVAGAIYLVNGNKAEMICELDKRIVFPQIVKGIDKAFDIVERYEKRNV